MLGVGVIQTAIGLGLLLVLFIAIDWYDVHYNEHHDNECGKEDWYE